MAAERLLDVWIVDLKKVYTSVPFTVVTDWLQQGRLLASDRVRLAGKEKWHPIENVPALVPYVPKKQPLEIDDSAEAMAQIDLGLESPKLHEEEDDDVDMIPLIDVSLVLLIFFMMTTAVSMGVFSAIPTPPAKHQLQSISGEMFWVGIEIKTDAKKKTTETFFSLGKDSQKTYLVEPTQDDVAITDFLARELQDAEGEVKIRLRADKNLPIETIKDATLGLQELETTLNRARAADKGRLQIVVLGEVSEPTK
jgi:biopolymer transport protein ExbD